MSNITYLKTDGGNTYLNMVTNAFSRKIMGYAISDNMHTEAMLPAYKMALKNRSYPLETLIHHTDRGLQYCIKDYGELSNKYGVNSYMTENGDPYENALAERMNRTLKDEFGLGRLLPSRQKAYRLVEEAVDVYNN